MGLFVWVDISATLLGVIVGLLSGTIRTIIQEAIAHPSKRSKIERGVRGEMKVLRV